MGVNMRTLQEKSSLNHIRSKNHNNFFVIKSGLILHPSYPFFGATPDGIVNCLCCGTGVLEIKCFFRCKDESFEDAASQGSFLFRGGGW